MPCSERTLAEDLSACLDLIREDLTRCGKVNGRLNDKDLHA